MRLEIMTTTMAMMMMFTEEFPHSSMDVQTETGEQGR